MATIYYTNNHNFNNNNDNNINNNNNMSHYPQITQQPPTNTQPKLSWCEMNQKNKPQSNAVSGGIILILVSGLHISWGIFNTNIFAPHSISLPLIIFVISSWYIAAIFGGVLAILLIDQWEKRNIYYLSSSIYIISSIIFIVLPEEVAGIIIGRMLAGFGHGLVHATAITHAGEVAVKEIRGLILSSFHYCIITSVYTATILFASLNSSPDSMNPNILIGILGLIYSFMALVFIPFLTYESPVFLLARGRQPEAITNMIRLRNESAETWDIRHDIEEFKTMIEEDRSSKKNIFEDGNLRPFVLVTLSRLLFTLSFNLPLNIIRIISVVLVFYEGIALWAASILITIRFILAIFPIFTMDKFGRRKHLMVSGAGSSLSVLGLGICYIFYYVPYWLPAVFCFSLEIFASVGIGALPDVLASEAFPTKKKTLSIVASNTIDHIVNIILIVTIADELINQTFFYRIALICGSFMCGITGILYKMLPETSRMSLRQARNEFRKRGNIVFSGNRRPQPQGINYA